MKQNELTNEQKREIKLIFRKSMTEAIESFFEITDKYNLSATSKKIIKDSILICTDLVLDINL